MREALSSLTSRGRILLAAGLTAIVCALVLGQETLLRIGLFSALLPLAAVVLMARAKYRITLHRSVEPRLVACGQAAQVTMRVTNEGSTAPGNVLVEEELGYALGGRPRFHLGRARRGSVVEHHYRVSTDVRGSHPIGPAGLRVSDPLGLVEVRRRFRSIATLVALPPVVPLPGAPVVGASSGGENQSRPGGPGDSPDSTVRAYRRGDDVRRVHWRSSARSGELMVRNEESTPRFVSTLAMDVRARAHRGAGAASSFETAVRLATSLLTHLHHHGHDVRLVLGPQTLTVQAQRRAEFETALEQLAVLTPQQSSDSFDLHALAPGSRATDHGDLLLVLGELTADDHRLLAAAVPAGPTSTGTRAFVLDVNAWSVRQHSGLAARPLGGGWTSVVVDPRSSLAEAWRSVNR